MTTASPIKHISDTARWVAVYRAWETERKDAIFKDPFARRLAGEDWMKHAADLPGGTANAWPMIVRTKAIDELVMKAVGALGCDVVLNLAAGLDSRPYRLDLPAGLLWIEADLPGMIEYKEAALASQTPRCRLERVAVDLADAAARKKLLRDVAARGRKVLVMTEGLLIYLKEEQVRAIGKDLAAEPALRYWVLDFASTALLALLEKRWKKNMKMLKDAGTAFTFAVDDTTAFFGGLGWSIIEERLSSDEAKRFKREMPYMWVFKALSVFMPRKKKEVFRRMSGYLMLERKPKS